MKWRRFWGTAAALVLPLGGVTCSLATSGLAPEGSTTGEPSSTSSTGGSGGGGAGGSAPQSSSSGVEIPCSAPMACEAAPAGATAVWVKEADPAQAPGKCTDESTGTLYFIGPAGLPTCSACTCQVDPAVRCSAPELSCYYNQNDCSGAASFKRQSQNNECVNLPGIDINGHSNGSCNITSSPVLLTTGSCNSPGSANMTPAKWAGARLACPVGASQGTCASGELCAPTGAGPDGSKLCLVLAGGEACPSSFPNVIDAFSDGADSRSCTTCSCSVSCTGGSYNVHDADGCASGFPVIPVAATGCTRMQDIFDNFQASIAATVSTPSAASCNGGAPEGQVTGTGPKRLCCK